MIVDKILRFSYLVYGKEDNGYSNQERFNRTRIWNIFCGKHHKESKKTNDFQRTHLLSVQKT